MRSLVVRSDCRQVGNATLVKKSALMALASAGVLTSTLASAAGPLAVDDAQVTTVTETTTTTVTNNAPTAQPPSLPPPPEVAPPPAAPIQPPYSSGGSIQGPIYFNGPVWIIPAQPQMPAQLPQPPVYVQPPPVYVQPPPVFAPPPPMFAPPPKVTIQPQPVRPRFVAPVRSVAARGPVFGIGVRFSTLGIRSQEVFGETPTLMGGGVQLRFRNQGHWGFELGLDALRAKIAEGAFERTSFPFTFAPMLYVFKNRKDSHFNLYATAGFGLMTSDITLYEGTQQKRSQQFWEVMGHVGGGAELRFTRLALFADIRAVGMLLDQGNEPGKFYEGIDSGPVPPSSAGYKLNLGAMLWF